ncbi:MAG TPA: cupin domain-containing protein [Candidatus Elarobacter sp.]|nr:cupin domain-containing protein [Candidatus Elarobacter sp.]
MRKTVAPGVWSWSRWQPDRGLDFNGFFVETKDGNLVVDPVEPDDETLAELRERGVAAVLVTNRDHERFTKDVAGATGARVIASALDAPLLQHPVDRTVVPGETVFGWTVVGLDGFKTAGEIALYDQARRTAIVGDALWGTPAGALTLMPDAKLADPQRAALSARMLRAYSIDHLLVGDGACVFGNAHDVIGAMLDAREGVFVNRINLFDEVLYAKGPNDPAPFTATWVDAGRLIGAEKLGYGATRLARGEAFCPYHWHTREEELFVVMRGTPTLRTPRGTFVLRPGDCVAFATDPRGAHKLWNDADEEALVLMIANTDPGDACFYPDSRKFVVEASDTLVRDHPQLDYYDGETA